MAEKVIHPSHYNKTGYEVWDVLDAFFPDDPDKWNAGKYLLRAGHKGYEITDLEKCVNYLQRRIEKLKAAQRPLAVLAAVKTAMAERKDSQADGITTAFMQELDRYRSV